MPSEIWQSAETWNWRSLRELTIFARWRTWTECNSRFIWRLTKTIMDLSQCRNIIGNWFTILFQIRRRPCWVSTTRTTKWCKRTLSVPMYAIRFHGSLGPSQTLTRATRFVAAELFKEINYAPNLDVPLLCLITHLMCIILTVLTLW